MNTQKPIVSEAYISLFCFDDRSRVLIGCIKGTLPAAGLKEIVSLTGLGVQKQTQREKGSGKGMRDPPCRIEFFCFYYSRRTTIGATLKGLMFFFLFSLTNNQVPVPKKCRLLTGSSRRNRIDGFKKKILSIPSSPDCRV